MTERGEPAPIPFVLRALLWLVRVIFKVYFRLACDGREHLVEAVQSGKPMIAVGNHASHLDILAIISCIGPDLLRYFAFPGKRELWDNRLLAWGLTGLGAFPLDRETADVSAARAMIRALRSGKSVGIAPEGTRSPTGAIRPFKSGFVKLALKYELPVLPLALIGTYAAMPKGASFPRPRKIRVRIGPLIDLSGYAVEGTPEEREDALAEIVRGEVLRLWDG